MSADQDSNTDVIYIPLLEEGIPVLRPTQGRSLGNDEFLVLSTPDYDAETEVWEFPPGSIVYCVRELHDAGEILVARKVMSRSAG